MIRALQVILPGSIGAAAALATLWLLGGEHDEQPPLRDVGSTSSTDIEEGARHPDEVRALERRIAELELRQRSDSLAATVASEDVEPGSVSPVPPIRVDEQQDEYVYFESRVAQFGASGVGVELGS